MRIRRRRKIPPQIPTASMADIAFLLIIFFMVSTKFQVDKQTVKLPATRLRDEILAESAFISITKPGASSDLGYNGSIIRFSAGRLISTPVVDLEDLQQRIVQVVTEQPEQFFVVKADQEVPYETIDAVLGALRDSSARNLTFLSSKKT